MINQAGPPATNTQKKMTHNNLTPEEKKAAKQRASQIIRFRITTVRGYYGTVIPDWLDRRTRIDRAALEIATELQTTGKVNISAARDKHYERLNVRRRWVDQLEDAKDRHRGLLADYRRNPWAQIHPDRLRIGTRNHWAHDDIERALLALLKARR